MRYRLCRVHDKESDPLFPGVTEVCRGPSSGTRDYQEHTGLCCSTQGVATPRLRIYLHGSCLSVGLHDKEITTSPAHAVLLQAISKDSSAWNTSNQAASEYAVPQQFIICDVDVRELPGAALSPAGILTEP
jgi:hypothetical protein